MSENDAGNRKVTTPKLKLSLSEVIAKADNVGQIAQNIRAVATKAKEARADGVLTVDEINAIKDAAQRIVDSAQELADEIIEDIFDDD